MRGTEGDREREQDVCRHHYFTFQLRLIVRLGDVCPPAVLGFVSGSFVLRRRADKDTEEGRKCSPLEDKRPLSRPSRPERRSHWDNNEWRGEEDRGGTDRRGGDQSRSQGKVQSLCCPEGGRGSLTSLRDKDRKTLTLYAVMGELLSTRHLDVKVLLLSLSFTGGDGDFVLCVYITQRVK